MRSVISCDRFEIKQFKNILWEKGTVFDNLPEDLRKIDGVRKNIERNGCWYFCDSAEYCVFAFFANIGKDELPLIEKSCYCTWYNSNMGGVYLVGKEKNTGALFAPVVNQKLPR